MEGKIEGVTGTGAHGAGEEAVDKQAGAVADVAQGGKATPGVDEGGEAGIGGAGQPAILLHGAEQRKMEMLYRSGTTVVPRVVADIDQNLGSLGHAVAGQFGEH